jgi:aryl-alcohol dehydrogenase-like predicted oxidoreductase
MHKRTLGNSLEVSAIGLGCMGISTGVPPFPPKQEWSRSVQPHQQDGRRTSTMPSGSAISKKGTDGSQTDRPEEP